MELFNTSGKALYAQLSRDEMRLVMLGNGKEIVASHTVPVPAGAVVDGNIQDTEMIQGLLKKAVRRPEFKACRKIVFSLCTSQVITETVTTPDLPAKRIEKILLANVDMYFPVDMKEYKLQWQIIGPVYRNGNRETQVQLWAVPTAMLTRYYEVANACGLSVARIDYCGSSIAGAVGASFSKPTRAKERAKLSLNTEISFGKKKKDDIEEPAEEPVPVRNLDTQMHIFIENDLLGATFVQGNQVVMQRFISCGSSPSAQFIELSMMVEFFRSMGSGRGSQISGFVAGGLAEDEELVSELSDVLGIDLSVYADGYEPQFILCVGAASSTLDFGIPILDAPKAGRSGDNQLWQYALVAASGLLLVGTVVLLLTSRLAWNSKTNKLKNEQQMLLIQVKQTAEYADKYNKYNSEYEKYSADWETIFKSLRTYNDNLVLALEELEMALPVNTDVATMQIGFDGLTVQFACKSKEEAAYLIMALREMEYVDLVYISSLVGGGGGPATSYGSPVVEEPPVDGSKGQLSDKQIGILADLMMANMDQQKMMKTLMGLSDAEMDRLEDVYGKKPSNKNASLKALRGAYANGDIFQKRANAVHEMLTTNPFAVLGFVDLVKADMKSDSPVLLQHIILDLMQPENADIQAAVLNGTLQSPEQAMGYMERLVAILCKNNTTLTATEDLFATEGEMEKWYVYYLEMELGQQNKNALAFLDMNLVVSDLREGSFNTGDKNLDKKLNDLIPDVVWTTLKNMKDQPSTPDSGTRPDPNTKPGPDDYSRATLMLVMKKFSSSGKTGDTYLDPLFKGYVENEASGDARWDSWLKKYEHFLSKNSEKPTITKKPDDYAEDELISMLFQYLSANTSGDDYLDTLFDFYLATGSTGDRAWDNWLKTYKKYMGDPDGPTSGSPGDFPVFFIVSLKYKEELLKEELDRKGLDYSEKIEKVEVLG